MAKFHVNPQSGNAGPCKAKEGKCPFGGASEHFGSPEEARAAFEMKMAQRNVVSSTNPDKMWVKTPACQLCGNTALLEVDKLGLFRWKEQGAFVQNAFPNLSADERELLISGTHAQCWENMFGGEED